MRQDEDVDRAGLDAGASKLLEQSAASRMEELRDPRPGRSDAGVDQDGAVVCSNQEAVVAGPPVVAHETFGRIEIEYYGDDDLQRILSIVGLNSSDS